MISFLLRKLFRLAAVFFGASLLVFALMHAVPGSPWSNYSSAPRMQLGLPIDNQFQVELNRRFGLELPLWRQYTRYMFGDVDENGSFFCGAVCGNLGPSIQRRGRSVTHVLFTPPKGQTFWFSQFGYSIRLVLLAALFAAGLGIPLGIHTATRPKALFSKAVSVLMAASIAIPNFVLGLLAVVVFAAWLKLIKVLPDWNEPVYWIISASILALMPMAHIARVTRAALLNTLGENYVRAARARGLPQSRVIYVHVLRNAAAPILIYLGPTLIELFTGLFIVETLYSFPGFGRLYWDSVLQMDYPVVLGMTLLYAAGMQLINLLTDILSKVIDPRLRSEKV